MRISSRGAGPPKPAKLPHRPYLSSVHRFKWTWVHKHDDKQFVQREWTWEEFLDMMNTPSWINSFKEWYIVYED